MWHIGYLFVWFCFKFFIRKNANNEKIEISQNVPTEEIPNKKHKKKNKKLGKNKKDKTIR
jgi:hypothetical protein